MESITTNCLINLAFDLSNDWRELARVLDLSEEVPRICEDYRRNVSEQAYRMLKTWVGKKGSKATYQVLREALAHETVLRNDLVQKYCEGRNRSSLDEEIDLEGLKLKAGVVASSDLPSIAKELGIKWVWIGRLLGLKDSSLDVIRENHTQVSDCQHKMLELWCKEKTTGATYQCLARALSHRTVSMRAVAEKFCVENQGKKMASAVSSGEGIEPLNERLRNLELASSPRNDTGAAEAGTRCERKEKKKARQVLCEETDG